MTAKKNFRKTVTLDAKGKILGRLASYIAIILQGKNKPNFTPNLDIGDRVIVRHVTQARFTGRKLKGKHYFKYSGYPGGLKKTRLDLLFKKSPSQVLRKIVYHMLPKNKLRDKRIKRLVIKD